MTTLLEDIRDLVSVHGVSSILETLMEIVQEDACLYIAECKKEEVSNLDRVAEYNELGRRIAAAARSANTMSI